MGQPEDTPAQTALDLAPLNDSSDAPNDSMKAAGGGLEPECEIPTEKETCCSLLKQSCQSLYLVANITYVLYALLIISIHFEAPDSVLSSSSGTSMAQAYAGINYRYRIAAVVHLLNAVMYVWVWVADGYGICHRLQIPEYLNIAEAGLYWWSAGLYEASAAEGFSGPVTTKVQSIELAASVLELFAACGWATTWFLTYPRIRHRGWTLEDPDLWAAPTIVLAGVLYVIYNIEIAVNPNNYGSAQLYFYADLIYLVNAFLYLSAAMRDVGWYEHIACCCSSRSFPLPVLFGPWPEVAPYDAKATQAAEALYEGITGPWAPLEEVRRSPGANSTSSTDSLPDLPVEPC